MMKKILLVLVLTLVSIVYARKDYTVLKDSLEDSKNYRLENPVNEVPPERAVAGDKIKKSSHPDRLNHQKSPEEISPDSQDTRIRYWNYTED